MSVNKKTLQIHTRQTEQNTYSIYKQKTHLTVGTHLADHHLVLVVVTGQVRQDTSSTGHHINVVTAEQLNQSS